MKNVGEFDYEKATQAINFLARSEGGEIDKLKLIKLIYFADRYHIRRYGRPIFNDTYFAMKYGPVASSVANIADLSTYLPVEERQYAERYLGRNRKSENSVKSLADMDSDLLAKSEIEALKFAYQNYGRYKASTLVNVTHKYPEWAKFSDALESGESTREIMNYLDFFQDPEENSNDKFKADKKTLSAAKDRFSEDYRIAEAWK